MAHQAMKLSPKEENFLKHWMHDEFHFMDNSLPRVAKKLQRESSVKPGELAEIIIAWMPDTQEQARIFEGVAPADPPEWPWASRQEFDELLSKAQAVSAARNQLRRLVAGKT